MAPKHVKEHAFEIAFPPKGPIPCISNTPPEANSKQTPPLIFTHGAGGTHTAAAMQIFTAGFAPVHPIIRFQGPMNLKSRTAMFAAVLAHHELDSRNILGGRSMGARAAVMAATSQTSHLVLASYPLQANGKVRDEILMDIPAGVKVVFVSGDRDSMCDLALLQDVRRRMKVKTWMVTVKKADHGMNVTPKKATEPVGELVGDVIGKWLLECDEDCTEGEVYWDVEEGEARWTGWCRPEHSKTETSTKKPTQAKSKQDAKGKKRKIDDTPSTGNNTSKARKSSRSKAKK